ncbi:MAG: HAMP domain-containing sensor histidine kinase [Eubacteriales bacterium]
MNKKVNHLEFTLRQKFVRLSFSVVFVVLSCIVVVANFVNFLQVELRVEEILAIIANNDGTFPQPHDRESGLPPLENENGAPPIQHDFENSGIMSDRVLEEAPFTTRFFTVSFTPSGEVGQIDTSRISRINPEQAVAMSRHAYEKEEERGTVDSYRFDSFLTESGATTYIFVDISEDLYFFRSFLIASVIICGISLVCVLVLLHLLSKKAVAPIVETYARQKAFITDMSHELKTPLAIVKANTEVIELEHGSSDWTESSHRQIEKLTLLIHRLLSLAKLEEEVVKGEFETFSLSKLVLESAEQFGVICEQKERRLVLQVQENISFCGEISAMRQLLDILLENAVKYSVENSDVTLRLKQEKQWIILSVMNRGENIEKGNYDKWFERFYREESSRNSETGGFGLGLSAAKRLVKNHGGKVTATSPDGGIVELKVELKSVVGNKNISK